MKRVIRSSNNVEAMSLVRYKGHKLMPNSADFCWDILDSNNDLEATGFSTEKAAKEYVDKNLVTSCSRISASKQFTSTFPVNHGSKRYMCHMTEPEDDLNWSAQLTRISPYDDAEYVWAKIDPNKQVKFIKDGRIIDKMQMDQYDEDNFETFDEYVDYVLDSVVTELINMNKDIKPVMVHN